MTSCCCCARRCRAVCSRRRAWRPCSCWPVIMWRSVEIWTPPASANTTLCLTSSTAGQPVTYDLHQIQFYIESILYPRPFYFMFWTFEILWNVQKQHYGFVFVVLSHQHHINHWFSKKGCRMTNVLNYIKKNNLTKMLKKPHIIFLLFSPLTIVFIQEHGSWNFIFQHSQFLLKKRSFVRIHVRLKHMHSLVRACLLWWKSAYATYITALMSLIASVWSNYCVYFKWCCLNLMRMALSVCW